MPEHIEQMTAAPGETRDVQVPDGFLITKMEIADLKAGDHLIATVAHHVDAETLHRFREALAGQFPDCKVTILSDCELKIVRA